MVCYRMWKYVLIAHRSLSTTISRFSKFDRQRDLIANSHGNKSRDRASANDSNHGIVPTTQDSSGKRPRKTWRKREQFRQQLKAESGVDETGEAPIDRRVANDFVDRKVRRQRRIAMNEMARRKYYDYPVEDNLLTWKAKEQIFQLRASNREVWTPDRIAESFPISAEAARRLLRRKWPPTPTGEDIEEVIRRHDEEVRRRWKLIKKGKTEDGLLSAATLHMIRSGQVKLLPMYASENSTLSSNEIDQQKEPAWTIMPEDGPFVKLYKTHLQYLARTSSPESADIKSQNIDRIREALIDPKTDDHSKSAEQLLRAYVFPEDKAGTENVVMPYEQFRRQLEASLRNRNRPEDKKYLEWMNIANANKGTVNDDSKG